MGLSHFTVMSRFLLPFLCIVLVTFTESRRYRSRSDTTTTTSMTSEEDDEYMTAAKSLIDAGTCDEVTSNDVCGGDPSSSYYKEFQYNGYRVIISNGVPDHQAEHDAVSSNPNTRCEVAVYGGPHQPIQGLHSEFHLYGKYRPGHHRRTVLQPSVSTRWIPSYH